MMNKNEINQPLISVLVPCYNVERYLRKCVDSILNQTYKNLEIWLVDDGSPDSCGQFCDEYAKIDDRIKVIHKENGGISDARNVAVDHATGEWITFVDSDDYVSVEYVETLYNLVQKYDCEVSVACFRNFYEGLDPQVPSFVCEDEKMTPMYAVEQMFYQEKFDTAPWGKLYHRRLFEKGIRYPKGLVFEDFHTTFLLLLESNGVAFTSKVIYFYLLRASSIEGAYSPKKMENGLAVSAFMDSQYDLLKPIEKAYRCRKFSFFCHLVIPAPKNAAGRDVMIDFIKKNRWKVLIDRRARKKARYAALFSYLGFDFIKFVFSIISNRRSY